jgi:hypothetical protein
VREVDAVVEDSVGDRAISTAFSTTATPRAPVFLRVPPPWRSPAGSSLASCPARRFTPRRSLRIIGKSPNSSRTNDRSALLGDARHGWRPFSRATSRVRLLPSTGTSFQAQVLFGFSQSIQLFGSRPLILNAVVSLIVPAIGRQRACRHGGGRGSNGARFTDSGRGDIEVAKLVDYALRLDVGVVIRRLGFLLESSGVGAPNELERLRARLTDTYHLLDPTLPAEGRRMARWRLRLNVSPEELQAARST